MAIRRELALALRKVDAELQRNGYTGPELAPEIKLQVVQTGIFASALRVVEFFDPVKNKLGFDQLPEHERYGLSSRAHKIASKKNKHSELEPLLSGPMAVVAFPTVSPQHLKAVLSILSPSPDFPAPKRKANPDYHTPEVQGGLQKLMLLAARVEGKVFDQEGTKWIGGIEGGLDGLRAQLVAMLQGVGAGLANALEGASRSLYFTVESRRMDMEEKENPSKTEE
jgi:ribosomal protein L10